MTPGTRLLEALTAWIDAPDRFARDGLEADVIDAFGAVSTARALYPAAHAIGDRVSVVYPDERKPGYEDFTGTVVGVEFTDTGVDYRVLGDGDPDYTVVEAGFVRAVPAVDARLVADPSTVHDIAHAFVCPKCGGAEWGTYDCTQPKETWTGVCHGCRFTWNRATQDGDVGLGPWATQPLCPSRSEGSPLLMCEGLADHAGPHHALARTVTW